MKNSAQLSDGSRSQEIAEVKITYKTHVKASDRMLIQGSRDAEQAFRTLWDDTTIEVRESMVMLLLNRANKAIGFYTLSEGGTDGTSSISIRRSSGRGCTCDRRAGRETH